MPAVVDDDDDDEDDDDEEEDEDDDDDAESAADSASWSGVCIPLSSDASSMPSRKDSAGE